MEPIKVALVTLLFVGVFGQFPAIPLMYSIDNSSRFSEINIPDRKYEFFIPGFVNKQYNMYRTPVRRVTKPSDYTNLCIDTEKTIKDLFPGEWNNPKVSYPCRRYFCGKDKPHLLELTTNPNVSLQHQESFTTLHVRLHGYCTMCANTMDQKFDEYLNENATRCPWFDSDYCHNKCIDNIYGDTTCIYFRRNISLCYNWHYHNYVAVNDFTHHTMVTVYIWWTSFFLMMLSVIVGISMCFCMVIPEAIAIHHRIKESKFNKRIHKIGFFVNFRNFYIIVLVFHNFLVGILSFMDLPLIYAGFEGRYRNLSNFVSLTMISLLFQVLLLNWFHINESAAKLKYIGVTRRVFFLGVGMVTVSIAWGLVGFLFYWLRAPPGTLKDTALPLVMRILGGIWILSCTIIFTIILIGLIIYFVKILKKLLIVDLSRQDSGNFTKHIMSVKITKILITISVLIFVTQIFIFIAGLEYMISDDIFSLQFHFVFNILVNAWCGVILIVFSIIFIDHISLGRAYSCCLGN